MRYRKSRPRRQSQLLMVGVPSVAVFVVLCLQPLGQTSTGHKTQSYTLEQEIINGARTSVFPTSDDDQLVLLQLETIMNVPNNGGDDSIVEFDLIESTGGNELSQDQVVTPKSLNEIALRNELLEGFVPTLPTRWWTCHDQHVRKRKVVFVHVFKTAGSTFRNLLLRYAVQCQAGYALVVRCSGLSQASVQRYTTPWKNEHGYRKGATCGRKTTITRDRRVMRADREHSTVSTHLLHDYIDLLIGHLPMGVSFAAPSSLPTTASSNANSSSSVTSTPGADYSDDDNIMYITFVRNAVHKFVSGVSYHNKHTSPDRILEIIHAEVQAAVQPDGTLQHHHDGYSEYWLTPQQKSWAYDGRASVWSTEQRVYQSLRNLVERHVVVGVVEHLAQSAQLMQHLLDAHHDTHQVFDAVVSQRRRRRYRLLRHESNHGNATRAMGVVANKSRHSTADLVAHLQENATFFAQLLEYLKFDRLVYEVASKLHERQYEAYIEQNITASFVTPVS